MTSTFARTACCAVVMMACGALASSSAFAQGVDTNDPSVPPTVGNYFDAGPLTYPGGFPPFDVFLEDVDVHTITNRQYTPSGSDQVVTFDAVASGLVSVFIISDAPVTLSGQVQVFIGDNGQTTGTFATEMLSMDLSGPVPFGAGTALLRESPTLTSTGQTTVTDLGGGLYHIDSFFDVFTELSFDGGASWAPATGASHLVLMPEPASLGGLALGGVALLRRRRWR